MKLYITAPSPFARKCRIVAREKGLIDRIEEVAVDPYANAPELLASNPVVQVPTLIAGDGLPINDSPVICEYLDALGDGPRLLPADGAERLRVRRLETLGNQALEMGVKLLLELRRPEAERSPSWIARWTANMGRALDALEAAAPDASHLDMGAITAGVAVTWIGFRHPDFDWKTGRPGLVALQAALEARSSFAETRPA
ncbi:MAG: glutathione S-transferase N-terminal domain-containing protein [Brevundimonas sp.]|uniref:glutathione S-transferase N-terminal domain-containing protein n=1 Tax=Brevundimonas sp. TaxID=1871086 RepID=UPI002723B048|nr:glutathione S-transferase N-terminal domain-containing protein [Brevundimonas sp.]MDO9587773.1 glutathione S-transferase N-terminal domain-containing protein [Brevundimonas sp.]MDP3370832.1 glutathione S-transferase N-terminal domain-containing protein [Brevundimonas sp.]MDP3657974.1 glutathione S-transferase N-terminal domain-containing protein [Brevundimonas sp.]MDZ4112613.1 glutathione S-transferase N-terminal domain-containing protein [Brevundimonas sp.]